MARHARTIALASSMRLMDARARNPAPGHETLLRRGTSGQIFIAWCFWRCWLLNRRPTRPSLALAAQALGYAAQRAHPHRAPKPTPPPTPPPLDPNAVNDVWGLTNAELAELLGIGPDAGVDLSETINALTFDDIYGAETLGLPDAEVAAIAASGWDGAAIILNALGQGSAGDGGDGFQGLQSAGDFYVDDPYFLAYLQNQVGYQIAGYDDTTLAGIADELQDVMYGAALDGGSGDPANMDELTALLDGVFPDWGSARAYMIATTEYARAETFGSFARWWQLGAPQKIWQVSGGACQRCLAQADAGPVLFTDPFPGGWMAPPAHPLCRCNFVPYGDTSNPNAWQPRGGDGYWDAAITALDFADWPNMPDGLPDIQRLRQPAIIRVRRMGMLAPKPGLVAATRILRDATTTAALDWAASVELAIPRTVAGLDAILPRLAKSGAALMDPHRVAAADHGYLAAMRAAARAAAEAMGSAKG